MDKPFQWTYTDKVKDHFVNPRNVLADDEDFQADGEGTVGNMKCGDQMMFLIKVDKDRNTIADCRWKTYGCASAIASTSVLSEMIKSMPLDQAYHLSPKDIIKQLGTLPDNKIHCSVLGDKALRAAINDYYSRSHQTDKIEEKGSQVVCTCLVITQDDIEEAVAEGARTFYELQAKTKIATACGGCKEQATKIMLSAIQKIEGYKNH
jgi:NifU-like protein involved in Fe-S cluster formation/bacterioferritin-associated ferredoxin